MKSVSALPLALIGLCVACGSDKPPPKVPPPPVARVAPPPPAVRDVESNPARINIDKSIQEACGISNSDAHFAFDEASIQSRDTAVLDQLAECFSTGALTGEQMRLVGHTDNRGDEEYNFVLGERRANAVRVYLVSVGASGTQISTTSRGELEATGSDEAGWAEDRRVDIILAQ